MKIDFTEQEIRILEIGLMAFSENLQQNIKRIKRRKDWSNFFQKEQIDDKQNTLDDISKLYDKMIDKTRIHL